jgi:hypothetical protein
MYVAFRNELLSKALGITFYMAISVFSPIHTAVLLTGAHHLTEYRTVRELGSLLAKCLYSYKCDLFWTL